MILIVLAAVCALTVPLTGGSLTRLATLPLRRTWLAPLALVSQVMILTIAPQGNHAVHAAIHVGTYLMIGAFLWANREIPGVRIIAVGTASNALAIIVNAGVMPSAAAAERLAGVSDTPGFHNSAVVAHPHLLWLGDIIPVPGPFPNVLSVGDCLIYTGMLVLLHRACRPRHAASPDVGGTSPAAGATSATVSPS